MRRRTAASPPDEPSSAGHLLGIGALVALVLFGLLLLVAQGAAAQNAYSASEDGTVRKIDGSGSEVWPFSGLGNKFLSVASDVDGNVYAGDDKGHVFKVNSTGSQVWSFDTGAPKVNSIAVDGDGNVYVGDDNGDVTKLNSTGSQVWSVAPSGGAKVHDVSPDGDGNVYAGTEGKEVVKLNSTGATVWRFTANGKVLAVTVNPAGDVFSGDEHGEILKIDASGSQNWSFKPHENKVLDLAFDGKGALYSASEDKTVKKIDPSDPPSEVWSFSDPDDKKPFGLGIDSDHHVHYGSESGKVFKLETDGSGTLWTFTGHTNFVNGVDVDPGAFTMSTDGTPPTVSSITTLDRDGDGKVDGADVVFSEAIDDSTISPSNWTIGGVTVEAVSTTVNGDGDADDEKIQLRITTDGNEVDGTDAKDVTYAQGTTEDLAGHKLADVASGDVSEQDGAKPVVDSIATLDRDGDGQVDRINVTYSEPLSGSAEIGDYALGGTDAGNVSLDGATISGSTVEVAVTGPTNDTGLDLTLDYDRTAGTADSIRDGAGNAAASFTGAPVSDAAAPQVQAITTHDTDGDGKTDAADVTFTEDVDDGTIQPGDWAMEGTAFEAVNTTVGGDDDADDEKVQLRITTDADEIDGIDAKDVTYAQGTTADLAGNLLPDVTSGDVTETAGNTAPTADFDFTPSDPSTADTVDFTDQSTDSDGSIASWAWEFGDGNTSTDQHPSHSYAADGTYTVNLTVTDDDGATHTASQSLTVSTGTTGGDGDEDETGPDLVVLDIDVSPLELEVGGNVTVQALVENRGATGTASVTFNLDTGTLHSRSVHLAAGARTTVSVTVTVDQAGTYQVQVNGVPGGSFQVIAGPSASGDGGDGGADASDVRLAEAEVDPDRDIQPGDTVTLTLRWTNEGTAPGQVDYTIALDGRTVASGSVTVDPGQTVTRTLTLQAPGPGTYTLSVDGDPVGSLTVEEGGSFLPGPGAVLALLALAGAAVLWFRRDR